MAFSMRLNEEDEKLIRTYADMHGLSISDFMRNAAIEKIEDEYDLKVLKEALEEHKKDPKTYTLQEVWEDING